MVALQLDIGYSDAEAVASSSLASLLGLPSAKFAHCKLLNESVCAFTQQATSDDQPISFQVANSSLRLVFLHVTFAWFTVSAAWHMRVDWCCDL
jgi:hypothetical protein